GYCPDVDSFWESMSGRQFVRTLAGLHGYSTREARERTEEALAFVGMSDRADRRLGACSRGMRQRIKLAQALVHDPQIILLDEPMTGVDPGGRRELNELLRRLAERGKTIVMSTHLLREVESLADGILMIARGRLVARGPIAEIRRYLANQPMTLEVEAVPLRLAASKLAAEPAVESVRVEGTRLLVRTQNVERVLQLVQDMAIDDQVAIARLGVLDAGAEAVFSYLDRGAP
ncbi:MAG TPA: ABC transporter ATP-binding protein, partial [Pirellulales bacterium]